MTLDYNNPNHWGRSPLTDNILRIQQFRVENPEAWNQMIEDDLEAINYEAIENNLAMKPVGYFGLSTTNTLIKDMTETWGECLEAMDPVDTFWLLGRLGYESFLENPIELPPTDEAFEAAQRLDELNNDDRQSLIQALCDQNQPVGYYSLDPYNPLIRDMTETWGQNLGRMNENDTVWLIGQIGDKCWEEQDEGITDEASQVRDRLHELSYYEKLMLIRVLAQ